VRCSGPGYSLGIFDGNILEQRIRRLMEGHSGGLGRAPRRSGRRPGSPGGLRRNGFQPESFGAGAERALRRTRACRHPLSTRGISVPQSITSAKRWRKIPTTEHSTPPGQRRVAGSFIPTATLAKSPLLADARQQYLEILARAITATARLSNGSRNST